MFFYILLLLCLPAKASWQRAITNYARHSYKAASQNWMIMQSKTGWMYFANNKGLLEFDGVNNTLRETFDVVAHHTSITIESYFCSMQMQNYN